MTITELELTAAEAAGRLRQAVAEGVPVTAAQLAEAEAAERLERLRLDAEQRRSADEAERERIAALDAERAAVQSSWQATVGPDAFSDLEEMFVEIAESSGEYLTLVQARLRDYRDLVDRARAAGFQIDDMPPAPLRSAVSRLEEAIRSAAWTSARDTLPLERRDG